MNLFSTGPRFGERLPGYAEATASRLSYYVNDKSFWHVKQRKREGEKSKKMKSNEEEEEEEDSDNSQSAQFTVKKSRKKHIFPSDYQS